VSDMVPMGIQPDLLLDAQTDLAECADRIASLLVQEQVLIDFEI